MTVTISRVPTRRTSPAIEVLWVRFGERTLTGTLTGAQKVLEQREYFFEPLVASRGVDKPLEHSLWCVRDGKGG